MENEFMKRGYLLPDGCKDLTDVAKFKAKQDLPHVALALTWRPPNPLPAVTRQVFIPPDTTVKKLAALLGQKPFEIIGDLMQLGMFATVDEVLEFTAISAVARLHGFEAIKAG
jgi:hypothetical protein